MGNFVLRVTQVIDSQLIGESDDDGEDDLYDDRDARTSYDAGDDDDDEYCRWDYDDDVVI